MRDLEPKAQTLELDLGKLPEFVRVAVEPLFDAHPLESAMAELLPMSAATGLAFELARAAAERLGVPELQAGIWLYVDDLDRSHALSQTISSPTGSFWHAIMHRREGDFGNSKYWLRQAGTHPVWAQISGYDPFDFVDRVAASHRTSPPGLVEMQRREWWELFAWCAEEFDAAERMEKGARS